MEHDNTYGLACDPDECAACIKEREEGGEPVPDALKDTFCAACRAGDCGGCLASPYGTRCKCPHTKDGPKATEATVGDKYPDSFADKMRDVAVTLRPGVGDNDKIRRALFDGASLLDESRAALDRVLVKADEIEAEGKGTPSAPVANAIVFEIRRAVNGE